MILAIDPGNEQSGYALLAVEYDDAIRVADSGVVRNDVMLEMCEGLTGIDYLVCEGIASYGMAVGKEVFDTCIWIGRFGQVFGWDWTRLVYRKEVKLHLCGSLRAKDANIRQALLDKFGGKDLAVGKKTSQGPLYGVKSHAWSALAVGVTAIETGVLK